MADRIERLVSEQRAFAGDASHQLRTPLTALQLRLERSLEMIESDPAGAAQRPEAAMGEADRLQRLVEGLLILSRSDNTENLEVGSETQGNGLGLAIVDRLTRASGGHAELINLEPSGLSANAYFPTA
jgi:signal transduction histidine kinase